MTRAQCTHGVSDGCPCDSPDCYNYQRPRPDPLPPAPRRDPDAELIAALSTTSAKIDPSRFDPDAVRTWERVESHSRANDDRGSTIGHGKGFIGKAPDGERVPRGALPWWWCYGNQPIHVKGDGGHFNSNEAGHLVKGISEANAQRIIAEREIGLAADGARSLNKGQLSALLGMNPAQMRRGRRGA